MYLQEAAALKSSLYSCGKRSGNFSNLEGVKIRERLEALRESGEDGWEYS